MRFPKHQNKSSTKPPLVCLIANVDQRLALCHINENLKVESNKTKINLKDINS